MQNVTIILIGLVILAYASTRSPNKTKLSRFQHLKGWQKLFGVLAVVMALLILLNPEFLALGLIGDTALFDMLVLALSLQSRTVALRAFHGCVDMLSRGMRWLVIPSPGLRYLLAFATPLIVGTVAMFQRAVHRILS
jgi:uncharacterized membrane protein YkgB